MAFAQEGPKVDVQAQVVHALESGNQFEPASFERFTHSVTQILDEWLDATAAETSSPLHVMNPQP